jgi:hypothetical protein
MNYILVHCFIASLLGFGAAALDGGTSAPLQWLFGCVSGGLGVGMWVGTKVTKLDERLRTYGEQQGLNMARLDRFDARLCAMDDKLDEKFVALSERLFVVEKLSQH